MGIVREVRLVVLFSDAKTTVLVLTWVYEKVKLASVLISQVADAWLVPFVLEKAEAVNCGVNETFVPLRGSPFTAAVGLTSVTPVKLIGVLPPPA